MIEVSVVIPTYNAERYIAQTLKSVLGQQYVDFEVLVIDDKSNDSTVPIIESYAENDQRIKLIQLNDNSGGPATPRNVGIDHASGEYIAFMDADDLWHAQKLYRQITAMKDNNGDFSSTAKRDFKGNVGVDKIAIKSLGLQRVLNLFRSSKKKSPTDLFISNDIYTSSVIVKTSLVENHKFLANKQFIAVEDMRLWLDLLLECENYVFVNEPLLEYRLAEDSLTHKTRKIDSNLRHLLCISHYYLSSDHDRAGYRSPIIKAILVRAIITLIDAIFRR